MERRGGVSLPFFCLASVVLVAVLRLIIFLVLGLGGVLGLSGVILLVLGVIIVLFDVHVKCPFAKSS